MLRRFSTKVGLSRSKKEEQAENRNGAVNGAANGAANGTVQPAIEKRRSSFGPLKALRKDDSPDHSGGGSSGGSRGDVDSSFAQFAQLLHASRRPLPNQSADRSYLEHAEPSGLLGDVRKMGFKDAKTLMDVVKTKASGELQDDKTYIMERTIQLVASLPTESKARRDLTNAFVDELWNSLQHPPLSYLGDKFQYRQADGSYNNIMYPHLGAANTPYARSVPPLTIQPGGMPDPGVIFDSVMARKVFVPHPNKISSVFFYWASLVIHDLFQTDHRDFNNSQTSSYLDLSTLYGDTQEDQDQIRTFKDGRLKPDCFSEQRLLGFPPGCGVILIMLNRFHNHVVEQLALINEGGRFTKPNESLSPEKLEKSWAKYDNDLFQTGRLIVCGLYINITLMDYVRTIINLNRSTTSWTLDPRAEMGRVFGKDGTPAGIGNQVSAEFNLAYRWHSCISERDEKWTEDLYRQLFGKDAEDVSLQELMMGLGKWEHSLDKDPLKRPFAGLKRDENGNLPDDELVELFASSVEDLAGSFGPNNVPKCLKAITILGMQQSRAWNLGSLNEFRKFFSLKPHATFEDICDDPVVSDQLKNLYEHPDFVEMYPGMISESPKVPMIPGAGITPNFTISRAILSDAVALVRGDRFYTIDYNARNLTNWGYNEVQYDMGVQEGAVFYKLVLRAFPNHFKANSIYAHQPMTIPDENKKIQKSLNREWNYSWERPQRASPQADIVSYQSAKFIEENATKFNVVPSEPLTWLASSDFKLSSIGPFYAEQQRLQADAVYQGRWLDLVKSFYETTTLKLLKEKSYKLAGVNQVDITRDIGNIAPVYFASELFSLPLKTPQHTHGIYTEHELQMIAAVIFTTIYCDSEPDKSLPVRLATRSVTSTLAKLIEVSIKAATSSGIISGIVNNLNASDSPLKDYGGQILKSLADSGLTTADITWGHVIPTLGAVVATTGRSFTEILDYYLSPAGKQHLPEINRLAKLPGAESDDHLLRYALEGIRLHGSLGSYRMATEDLTLEEQGKIIQVKKGDRIFTSFVQAGRDEAQFPEPSQVKLDRPLDRYVYYGTGPSAALGREASQVALTAMLRTVGRLDNLRRAPGPAGELKKLRQAGGYDLYMRFDHGSYTPLPTTMKINWDGDFAL